MDIVEPAGCGLIVPFGDPEAAAKAVLRLRDGPDLRADLGRRGYEAARQRFHWPVHAERFVAQLEAWAGRSRAPRRTRSPRRGRCPSSEPPPCRGRVVRQDGWCSR